MNNPTIKPVGYIYIIHAVGTNRIKIGYTVNPKGRLEHLQTGSPFPLQMIGYWPGTEAREKEIHCRLAKYHCVGEWFEIPEERYRSVTRLITAKATSPPLERKRIVRKVVRAELLPQYPETSYSTVRMTREEMNETFEWASGEMSSMSAEFQAVLSAKPDLAEVLAIWEGRAGIVLERLSACRRFAD